MEAMGYRRVGLALAFFGASLVTGGVGGRDARGTCGRPTQGCDLMPLAWSLGGRPPVGLPGGLGRSIAN
jgi:hypothetical protein